MKRIDEIRCMCDDAIDIPVVECFWLLDKIEEAKDIMRRVARSNIALSMDIADWLREVQREES